MARKFLFAIFFSLLAKVAWGEVEIPAEFAYAKSPMESSLNRGMISRNFPGLYDDVFAGIEGRIAGGIAADERQFPYQGLLFMTDAKKATYICSGSLITHSYLLTAAHCIFDFETISVYLGIINRISGPAAFTQDIEDKSHLIMHENYSPIGHINDIALIYLSTLTADVFDGERVALISLPQAEELNANLVGMEATVAGFGSTADTNKASDVLRYVAMPIISNLQCRRTFGVFVRETNLCMSGQGGRSVCSGDSGGPMTVEMTPGVVVQVGIVSFGHKHGCTLGHPGVFTRVTSYLDWIEGHVGSLQTRNFSVAPSNSSEPDSGLVLSASLSLTTVLVIAVASLL